MLVFYVLFGEKCTPGEINMYFRMCFCIFLNILGWGNRLAGSWGTRGGNDPFKEKEGSQPSRQLHGSRPLVTGI